MKSAAEYGTVAMVILEKCLRLRLVLLIFLTLNVRATQPLGDGIFIIKKPTKRDPCEQEVKTLIGGKRICTLAKPIVTVSAFEYATDILYSQEKQIHFVNLGITSKGVNILNQTIRVLPGAQFAVVVDNNVICTFTIYERMQTGYISLGEDLTTRNLETVRDALKEFQH